MTDRLARQDRKGQAKARRDCFLHHSVLSADGRWSLTCYACQCGLDAECDDWIGEHLVMYWLTKDNAPSNVWPSCIPCKLTKDKRDAFERAKTVRIIKAQIAAPEPSRWRSRPMQSGRALKSSAQWPQGRALKGSSTLQGSKASGWKKPMRGPAVRRERKP